MVEVRYRGGFGDNLFQYCFGRLLAERWGHELSALPLPHLPGTAAPVHGRRFLSPFQSWSGMAAEERQLGMLLRDHHIATPVHGRLVLYGWFQRWEYYRSHRDLICRWLAAEPPAKPAQGGDFAVCLRTRRPMSWEEPGIHPGKAPAWKRQLPSRDDILRLVERVPHGRLVLLTDDPHGEEVQSLMHLKPEVRYIDSFASWNWLRSCRRIALTVCHPAEWWAAWLSDAAEIFALDPWPLNRKPRAGSRYGPGWRKGRPLARPALRVAEPRWIYEW